MKKNAVRLCIITLIFATATFFCLGEIGVCFSEIMIGDLAFVEQIIDKGVWILGSAFLLFSTGYSYYFYRKVLNVRSGKTKTF